MFNKMPKISMNLNKQTKNAKKREKLIVSVNSESLNNLMNYIKKSN